MRCVRTSEVSEGNIDSGVKVRIESEVISETLTAMVPWCLYAVVGINAVFSLPTTSTTASSRVQRVSNHEATAYCKCCSSKTCPKHTKFIIINFVCFGLCKALKPGYL